MNKITEEQRQYITSNRLVMSMVDIAAQLGISYNRTRNFMIENNLQVDKLGIDKIKSIKRSKVKEHPPCARYFIEYEP
jgi:phage antirepressor YoqD-like protein